MATISPKCSMAGAIATGRMKKMAWGFHWGMTNAGTANHGDCDTLSNETIPMKRAVT